MRFFNVMAGVTVLLCVLGLIFLFVVIGYGVYLYGPEYLMNGGK